MLGDQKLLGVSIDGIHAVVCALTATSTKKRLRKSKRIGHSLLMLANIIMGYWNGRVKGEDTRVLKKSIPQ